MPKQAVEDQLTAVAAFLVDLGDLMHQLSIAVRDDNLTDASDLAKDIPSKKEITKNLVLLGKLLESQPWKKVKRNAG